MQRIKREELIQILDSVSPGLSTKDMIEQSSCFVFKNGWVFTYNDEISCRMKFPLELEGAVVADKMMAVLKKMPEDEVQIDLAEKELLIRGKNREMGVRMDAEIMLSLDAVEKPGPWSDIPTEFAEAVEIVQECAGTDETQFSTICVHLTPKWIEACDNYQMARYRIKLGVSKNTLVRKESIKHIVTLGMTKIAESENWLHFRNANGLVLSCRRYLEDFPNLDTFLGVKGTATALPKGLGDAVDRAETFSAENPDDDQILVELRDGRLRVKGEGVSGWYREVKKMNYKGPEMSFYISPKLLTKLSKDFNECEVAAESMKVDGGKFVYVTSLEKK